MRLAIIFDQGAVSAGELFTSLESYELVFVIGKGEYAQSFKPLLSTVGSVVELTGDTAHDAARLRAARISGLATFGDHGLATGAEIAAELGLPFHSRATARALTDKTAQRTMLEQAGLGVPRHRLLHSADEWDEVSRDLGFPLVVKPNTGVGSRNTHLVADAAIGSRLVAKLLDQAQAEHETALIAEQYLVGVDRAMAPFGDYVSVESVCSGGPIQHVGVTGKLPLATPFRETGQFYPAALSSSLRAEIESVTEAALRALGVEHGVTHTEIKMTTQGPRVIEVNGRLGGYIAELYERALGIDLIRVVADLALGRPVRLERRANRGVSFQYYSRPPLDANHLTGITGIRSVAAHPCIDAYKQCVKSGSSLPADMSSSHLDRISGTVDSLDVLTETLDECLALLDYSFTGPEGATLINGVTLRHTNARDRS